MTLERNISIRRMLLPRDTNPRGEIFGGALLAEIDLAGAVEARLHTQHDVATRYMNGIEFTAPVKVGDVVTFYTSLVKKGTTSLTIKVEVECSRDGSKASVAVTATEVVYVAIRRKKNGAIEKVPLDRSLGGKYSMTTLGEAPTNSLICCDTEFTQEQVASAVVGLNEGYLSDSDYTFCSPADYGFTPKDAPVILKAEK